MNKVFLYIVQLVESEMLILTRRICMTNKSVSPIIREPLQQLIPL